MLKKVGTPLKTDPQLSKAQEASIGTTTQVQWEADNRKAIAIYAQRLTHMGSPAARLHAWRDAQQTSAEPSMLGQISTDDVHGSV